MKMAVSNSNFNQLPSIKLKSTKKQEWKRKSSNITVTSLVADKAENALIAGKDNNGLIDCIPSLLMHLRRASKIDILKPPERIEIEGWWMNVEIAIDRTITSCRFFAVLAVVGTLAGSVLCFVEGCFLMLESYVKCFLVRAASHQLDHGMMQTAIEAIGTFFLALVTGLDLACFAGALLFSSASMFILSKLYKQNRMLSCRIYSEGTNPSADDLGNIDNQFTFFRTVFGAKVQITF